MSYNCFLSYASTDLAQAERIQARLVAAGLDVWFDKVRLQPGFDWHREIEAACESSRVVLPVLTPNWKRSEWTRYETYGAENVIPLLAAGKWEDVFTPPLARYQNAALPAEAGEADWQRLIGRIRECCARPAERLEDRVVMLEHNAIDHFVGRDELLTEIHERLFRCPTAALGQGRIQAVTALGGVGKTTLARHYAEKFWRPYRQMFWTDCRAGLESGFARVHDRLRSGEPFASMTPEARAAWARDELRRPDRGLSLLILDNAEDQDSVMPWLSNTGNCHTLITSRFTAWTGAIEKCEVWVLEPGPARELLLKSSGFGDTTGDTAEERAHADAVAKKLEYLPLALEQAARYLRDHVRVRSHNFAHRQPGDSQHPRDLVFAHPLGAQFQNRGALRLAQHAALAPVGLSRPDGGVGLPCARYGVARLRVADHPSPWRPPVAGWRGSQSLPPSPDRAEVRRPALP
jgi:hypothetical protein